MTGCDSGTKSPGQLPRIRASPSFTRSLRRCWPTTPSRVPSHGTISRGSSSPAASTAGSTCFGPTERSFQVSKRTPRSWCWKRPACQARAELDISPRRRPTVSARSSSTFSGALPRCWPASRWSSNAILPVRRQAHSFPLWSTTTRRNTTRHGPRIRSRYPLKAWRRLRKLGPQTSSIGSRPFLSRSFSASMRRHAGSKHSSGCTPKCCSKDSSYKRR